jgi:hypothetical protein
VQFRDELSGQYQTINGEEQITAAVAAHPGDPPASDWAFTLVGQDIFTRQPPRSDEIAARSRSLSGALGCGDKTVDAVQVAPLVDLNERLPVRVFHGGPEVAGMSPAGQC